jgi:hypothetical protein
MANKAGRPFGALVEEMTKAVDAWIRYPNGRIVWLQTKGEDPKDENDKPRDLVKVREWLQKFNSLMEDKGKFGAFSEDQVWLEVAAARRVILTDDDIKAVANIVGGKYTLSLVAPREDAVLSVDRLSTFFGPIYGRIAVRSLLRPMVKDIAKRPT